MLIIALNQSLNEPLTQCTRKTGTEENFSGQITDYGQLRFWPRGRRRLPRPCVGKPAHQCRYDRCLGWCWKIHANQPLARADGSQTLSLGGARFRLVIL